MSASVGRVASQVHVSMNGFTVLSQETFLMIEENKNIQALVLKAGRKRDHSIHILSLLVSATADITLFLVTLHIYYLIVSVHQKFQHGLWFPAQGSQGYIHGVSQSWVLI